MADGTTRAIRQTAVLSDDEQLRLFRWSADPFGIAHLELQWRPKETRFVLDVDGEAVSHVGLLKHTVRVGDRRVVVAGFGGVVTVPHAQRRGHATSLMNHAARFATDEWRVNSGLLFCLRRMVPYYVRLGWRTLGRLVQIDQTSGAIEAPIPVMVLPVGDFTWPDGAVELDSLPW